MTNEEFKEHFRYDNDWHCLRIGVFVRSASVW